MRAFAGNAVQMDAKSAAPQALSIEPRKVTSSASIYAVFAIE
jgi:hypothetical protein